MLDLVRLAGRRLRRDLRTTLPAMLATTLSLALIAASFSIYDHLFLRGLPLEEARDLIAIDQADREGRVFSSRPSDFENWSKRQQTFEGLAAYYDTSFNLACGASAERYDGAWISTNFLELVRVRPRLGSGFQATHGESDADDVALISDRVWENCFQRDPSIVGRRVSISGGSAEILGVLPPRFHFPTDHDIWIPWKNQVDRRVEVFGRRLSGKTLAELEDDLRSLKTTQNANSEIYADSFHHIYVRTYEPVLRLLLSGVFLVALICCFNVAHLLAARVVLNASEIHLRAALGADRRRLTLQILSEIFWIVLFGAILGVAAGVLLIDQFNAALQGADLPYWLRVSLSSSALGAVSIAALFMMLGAGLPPAFNASQTRLTLHFAPRTTPSKQLRRTRRVVVVAGVSAACILMIVAGLFLRTMQQINAFDPHFEVEGLWTARINHLLPKDATLEEHRRTLEDLESALARASTFSESSLSAAVPLDSVKGASNLYFKPQSGPGAGSSHWIGDIRTTSSFFETFRLPILEGRALRIDDPADVAVISESLARQSGVRVGERFDLWSTRDRADRQETKDVSLRVVGVTPDLHYGHLGNFPSRPTLYRPLKRIPASYLWITARSEDAENAETELRRVLFEVDPRRPIDFLGALEETLHLNTFIRKIYGGVFGVVAGVAMLLAVVGIYSVMSFAWTRRVRELAIRAACGASPRDLLRLLYREGLRPVVLGLMIGQAICLALGPLLRGFLFRVEPYDPPTYIAVALLLFFIAGLACSEPARRAADVEIASLLR